MKKRNLTKLLALIFALALVLSACRTDPVQDATPPPADDATAEDPADDPADDPTDDPADDGPAEAPETPSNFTQAPMLDGRDLPPVDERLPVNPKVVVPYERVGTFGGTIRTATIIGHLIHATANGGGIAEGRQLVMWCYAGNEIIGNLAESWEVSADATTYTFTLREGTRWSDGEPLTTADVRFWFDAVHSHPVLNPGWEHQVVRIEDIEVVDDFTFRVVFNASVPLRIYQFASFQWEPMLLPMHYMSQFHEDFNDEAQALADAAGFVAWNQYFDDRRTVNVNQDLPTLNPFILMNDGAGATLLNWERNPYFWKVDTAGNQLPYADALEVQIVEDADVVRMMAIAGDFTFQLGVVFNQFSDFPLYAEHAEAGNFEVVVSPNAEPNQLVTHINLDHHDPYKAALFQNVDFRRALSHVINRDQIVDTLFTVGPVRATVRGMVPARQSPWFDEEWETMHTEFDPDLANQLLDDLGLDQRNAAGFRLMENGEELTILLQSPLYDQSWTDANIMMAQHWTEYLGINSTGSGIDPSLWYERQEAGEFDVTVIPGGGGLAILSAGELGPWTGFEGSGGAWGVAWQNGFMQRRAAGEDISDVPAPIQRLWELGAAITVETDPAARETMLQEVFQIHKDNLFILGVCSRNPFMYLRKNYLINVPLVQLDWEFVGHAQVSQWFIEQ